MHYTPGPAPFYARRFIIVKRRSFRNMATS